MHAFDLVVGATFTASALAAPLAETGDLTRTARSTGFVAARDLLPFLMNGRLAGAASLLVMLRPSDLIGANQLDQPDAVSQLTENMQVYVDALARLQVRTGARCCLLVVPAPHAPDNPAALSYRRACDALAVPASVRSIDWQAFAGKAGTVRIFDPIADKLGQVPFTTQCLQALARHITAELCCAPDGQVATAASAAPAQAPAPCAAPAAAPDTAAFARFLGRLRLRVVCRPMTTEDSGFAARLAHTAATFHASANKLTEADFGALMTDADIGVLAIEVSDRFGSYGPSGFVVMRRGAAPLVEEFVVSCVVLGKQVEHVVLLALARAVRNAGASALRLRCVSQDGSQVAQWLHDLEAACPDGAVRESANELRFEPAALADAILASAPGREALEQIPIALPPGFFGGRA
ncbi:hypothetical protein G3N95_35905 [Paraburkholderia sp. Tr-20389]|uniref:hypothetical protein n=1 Tax=Paraburkholderia sp. Tr-20389 TaxID=2703903 RepID=UPI00197E7154|nr:hypothetical protein [Paraburkholderia sp. Tr-20389]MBN3758342.1 hypothetical protein [Paraburkholderia sp. Tr-20389]